MKFDMSEKLLDYMGEEIPIPPRKKGEKSPGNYDLKEACCQAVMSQLIGDEKLDWKEKRKLGDLGKIIWNGNDDFTPERIVLIQERLGLCFTQLICTSAINILDGGSEKKQKKEDKKVK